MSFTAQAFQGSDAHDLHHGAREQREREGQRTETTLARCLVAEAVDTALLLAAVVGSGIMGERLAPRPF